MFLQDKQNGTLIEIQDVKRLFNPNEHQISGRNQSGEEEQDPMDYEKVGLTFPEKICRAAGLMWIIKSNKLELTENNYDWTEAMGDRSPAQPHFNHFLCWISAFTQCGL
jgi:hypothetical protein